MIATLRKRFTRKLALFLILAGIAHPAFPAKRVTVEQLEHSMAALQGKSDGDQAWQLSDFELVERLSPAHLVHLETALPGAKARQMLLVLADQSQFLDPPAAEIPATVAPDLTAQRHIMSLVVSYVKNAIPLLPNFLATRVTSRFEDTPQLLQPGGAVPYQPMHRVETSSATVLYRDGREVVDTGVVKARTSQPLAQGLNSWGIFGPILPTVLVDAAQTSLAWSHWEKGAGGVQAVFEFVVPIDKSHYEVNFCCVALERATVVAGLSPFRRIVGYRGRMAVDPSTGTITRLAVEADLNSRDPVVKANILVEYGPVEIGGRTYFCPVKSIAIAVAQTLQIDPVYKYPLANQMQPLKASLSDVSFQQYHVFRAEARVVPENEAHADQPTPPSNSINTNTSDSKDSAATPPNLTASEAPENKIPPPSAVASIPNTLTAAPPDTQSSAPPVSEVTVTQADDLPDISPAPTPAMQNPGFTFKSTSRLVDVGILVYDKKGRPMTDLKPENFALYDNGAKQQIRFFTQASQRSDSNAPLAANQSPAATEALFTNRPATTESDNLQTPKSEINLTILMIDASNLVFGDLTYVREEMLRFLENLPPDEPVGLYIMKSYGFQILQEPNTNHAQLAATLTKWIPSAEDLSRAQDEEQRNREQFDYVHSIYDLAHLNGNESTDPESYSSGQAATAALAHPTDARLRALGANPERNALEVLEGVARHLSQLRGHKSLVWIASDNVLANWADQATTKEDQGSKFIQNMALQAQEALNEAHVSIYPLDASQLEAGGVGANMGTLNVVAVGMSDRGKDDPNLPNPGGQGAPVIGDATPGVMPGRITAQMHQDTHPIQPAFSQLAEATGGRALRRAGDIAAELNTVVDDGRAAYVLSFTPDSPPDDKYHVITLKLIGKHDFALRYRAGYEYKKEPATLKERFRQAIWQPTDLAEIAVSANPQVDSNGSRLRLNIAATDLALAQQPDRWTDELDIFLIERDDAALHAKITGQTVGLRLQPATYQRILREGLTFDERLQPMAATGSLRVVIVDENSARIGSITIPAAALKSNP